MQTRIKYVPCKVNNNACPLTPTPTSLNNPAVDLYDLYGKQASIADLEEAITLDRAVLGFVI